MTLDTDRDSLVAARPSAAAARTTTSGSAAAADGAPDSLVAQHLPALDGLRGLAVAVVVAFHLGRIGGVFVRGGWIGVDVFFVLSGFLITSLLLREHDRTGGVSLRAFWIRRARRLMPALVALLLTICVVSVLRDPAAIRRDVGHATWLTLGYVSNWGQALPASGRAVAAPFRHLWSLAVEEQVYLLWPLVMVAVLARRGARSVGTVAAAVALASAVEMAVRAGTGTGADRLYFGSDTHLQPVAVGAALGAALHVAAPLARKRLAGPAAIVGWLAFLALALTATRADSTDPAVYRGGLMLISLATAATVASIVLAPAGLFARACSWAPLGWLGRRSYGLYLWHWPIICWLTTAELGSGWRLQAMRTVLTLLVAELSFRVLEDPIRRGALRTAPRAVRLAAWSTPLVTAGLAGVLVATS